MLNRPQLVAAVSVVVGVLIVAAKLGAGLATGSLGLIGDAVHSLLDVATSAFALLAVRTAGKPADREHPFGHGRAENLSAFAEGVVLLLTALGIGYEAVTRLVTGSSAVDPALYAMAILGATIVIEAVRGAVLSRVGRASGSQALTADAANRGADVLSALAVLAGLVAARLGYPWADSVAALGVALLIGYIAGRLAWRSGDILIDRAPGGVEEGLRDTIAGVSGVREVRSLRLRRSGKELLGDATVSARRTLSVEGAQALSRAVQQAVAASNPDLDLTLVVESDVRPQNMVERVHAVAARLGGFSDVHNVTVEREGDGSLHLTLHAKLPGRQRLEQAAGAADDLEEALRTEFPQVSRVDVHLEPLEPDLVEGEDVTARRRDLRERVARLASEHPDLRCRDVELSSRSGRITAHVVVEMPGTLTLEQAHQVETDLEARLLTGLPELAEVVVRTTV